MSVAPNLCCDETKNRGTYTRMTVSLAKLPFLHDKGQSQCERTPLQGMDTKRCDQTPVAMCPMRPKERHVVQPAGTSQALRKQHINRHLRATLKCGQEFVRGEEDKIALGPACSRF